jgi:hypothetical protein
VRWSRPGRLPSDATVPRTDRLSTILAADAILVFDRSRVVERGAHTELLQLGVLAAAAYDAADAAVVRPASPRPKSPHPLQRSVALRRRG